MTRSARISASARSLLMAGVVTAVASLAACSDSPTAPQSPTLARPAASLSGGGLNMGATIRVRIADTTGATLKEAAWVWFYSGNDTLKIRDNTPGDLDPALGYVKVMMSKTNNYRVELGRSNHYMPDKDGFVNFQFITTSTSAAMNIDVGTLYLQRSPIFNFVSWDEFGALAGGATYNITTDVNWSLNLLDGDYHYDESTIDGLLIYTLNFPFIVKICEVKPPPKMVLTSQKCFSFPAKWGQIYTATFTHEHAIY